MKLRNQLLALSLLTLLLPWSGWKLVQELENFLRQAEENALLASGQTLTQVFQLIPGVGPKERGIIKLAERSLFRIGWSKRVGH